MHRRFSSVLVSGVSLLLAIALAGCAGGARSGTDQPGSQGVQTVAPGPAGEAQRASINESSEQDLAAALRVNGVSDPGNWAQILGEYKPYPTGEPGRQKIQQVLTQFEADADTTAKITRVVVP